MFVVIPIPEFKITTKVDNSILGVWKSFVLYLILHKIILELWQIIEFRIRIYLEFLTRIALFRKNFFTELF